MSENRDIELYLKKNLSEKRFMHSRRTAETAEKLCMLYGYSPEKGRTAGLLHDIAREISNEEIFSLVAEDGFGISKIEKDYPVLLHGRAGAVISIRELGINDEEILEAVRWHTTGRRRMNGITSILYVADYIEPGRMHIDNEFRKKIREMNLDQLVMEVVRSSITYCRSKGYSVAEQTFMLYHDLEKKVS
ncbi:MAG: bis(5'-nucleosyl)-tetraphosphatase (symmetrical) YqeK [Spirochaetales bacterium]|uniref:bis(5'-nucleosyl)-tetraphosphatase (symmetrical) n=1 Tax=Candidatus Thalassospirochaeta sargassi TaxID=3119039 RepID=A0AAJ1ID00_9SPIO|nr:bis(5'-nucleosyl)-tetraphosphatase (symmetrical) YqeK [Spirochaetales bacterium]